jgi:hypothetical protein
MELQEAVKRAMKDVKVTSLKNYFLASVFSITEEHKGIKEWTLLFYNPSENKVRDCFVNEKFVTLGEEQAAQKSLAEVDAKKVKVKVEKALELAKAKYNKKTINILVSLHKKESLLWTITMIGADITATSYDIDAATGKLIHEDTVSLMKRI